MQTQEFKTEQVVQVRGLSPYVFYGVVGTILTLIIFYAHIRRSWHCCCLIDETSPFEPVPEPLCSDRRARDSSQHSSATLRQQIAHATKTRRTIGGES